MVKFLRRKNKSCSKLGKGRKKKQIWRRPTGRDNKMRDKRRGYPAVVSVGYKKEVGSRGKLQEKIPKFVKNIKDLEKIKKNEIAVLGNVGKKKKIEIVTKAKEMKINFHNINTKTFLEKNHLKKKEIPSKGENKK